MSDASTEELLQPVSHEELESVGESENPTLDYFLGDEPDLVVYEDVEVKRIGVSFRVTALDDDVIKRCRERSRERQTKMEKQRGMPAETDDARMRVLLLSESITEMRVRLRSKEDAERENKPEFAPGIPLKNPKLMERYRRPEDLLRARLLPGERFQMADKVLEISGWDSDAIESAKN